MSTIIKVTSSFINDWVQDSLHGSPPFLDTVYLKYHLFYYHTLHYSYFYLDSTSIPHNRKMENEDHQWTRYNSQEERSSWWERFLFDLRFCDLSRGTADNLEGPNSLRVCSSICTPIRIQRKAWKMSPYTLDLFGDPFSYAIVYEL
jgi:hypothetical protein